MAQLTGTFVCPKGHASAEPDYCSECGAKLGDMPVKGKGGTAPGALAVGQICPDCGTVRERDDTVFCEVCGYNFATGAHGEVPPAAVSAEVPSPTQPEAAPPVAAAETAAPVLQQWSVVVTVDPSLRSPESPEPPSDAAPVTVHLSQPLSLIGRRNEGKGIFPEIALPLDEAVSRRHAVLQMDPVRGLLLRDIGAANGTKLNGEELRAMEDYPVKDGDEITLGHWSRIRLHAS